MVQSVEFDLRQAVLVNGPFGPKEVRHMEAAIIRDRTNYAILRDAVAELQAKEESTPASMVRLGTCLYLLGRCYRAIEVLKQGDGGAMAHFYLGRCHVARQQYDQGLESYQAAERAGYDSGQCTLARAEAFRYAGKPAEAMGVLDHLSGAIEQTAEYLAQRAATVAALGGNPSEVVALYERAVEVDHDHPGALFGLAVENDRRGNDELAMEMYKRAAARFPSFVGPLMNLGLMYEDREQYDRAAQCYQRVLDEYPDHARAALYFKDTEASHEQFYDEDAAKKRDRMGQILNIPVTDFDSPSAAATACKRWASTPSATSAARPRPSCWPARTSARPAWWRSRRCWPRRGCGSGSWPPNARRSTSSSPNRSPPTSRPCWPSRSPS